MWLNINKTHIIYYICLYNIIFKRQFQKKNYLKSQSQKTRELVPKLLTLSFEKGQPVSVASLSYFIAVNNKAIEKFIHASGCLKVNDIII